MKQFRIHKKFLTIHSLCLLLFLSLIYSCKKDKVPISVDELEQCDCIQIPEIDGPSFGYTEVIDSTYYLWPEFNPYNIDEILFLDANQPFNQKKLFKYNIVTQEKTLVFQGEIIGKASWAKNNWILLSLNDYQIWKIKSNGDSLTKLTFSGNWFYPEMNNSKDRFICYKGNAEPLFSAIYDLSGNIIDTFSCYAAQGSWDHSTYYANIYNDEISIINPYSNYQFKKISASNLNLSFLDFFWISASDGIYTNNDGVYRINIATNTTTKLKCTCDSKKYESGSLNVDKTKILFNKIVYSPIDATTLHVDGKLVVMNVDGSGEEEILIP